MVSPKVTSSETMEEVVRIKIRKFTTASLMLIKIYNLRPTYILHILSFEILSFIIFILRKENPVFWKSIKKYIYSSLVNKNKYQNTDITETNTYSNKSKHFIKEKQQKERIQ